MNGDRVARLHDDLAAILHEANKAGIGVMPLKGSLLTTRYYASPELRPMADLDLLVRSEDAPALRAVLETMGYRLQAPVSRRHGRIRQFINPGGNQIVSTRGDHPDNPRPVDVHTDLRRYLWVDFAVHDLTDFVWSQSQRGEILGERVWLPAPDRMLVYLATHALYHHLFGTGRLMHLLDLGQLAPAIPHLDPPDADWVYPALRLAARVAPSRFADADLSALARRTHPRLRRWAATVPLDERCGLNTDPTPPAKWKRGQLRWRRWHPSPQRLALAYGATPLLLAYSRHLITVLRYLRYEPS
jgi:hypothetical protein